MCSNCHIFTDKGKYYCPECYDPFEFCPFCGAPLSQNSQEHYSEDYWSWVKSLESGSDEWRLALKVGEEYTNNGRDLDSFLDDIKAEVERRK